MEDLIAGKAVPRHVIRYNKYKTFLICSVLVLALQSCFLVHGVIKCRRNRDIGANVDTCSESARTIWIPRIHNGRHDNTSADHSNFYCQTLDHKLSHLIDFLVVANRSTLPDKEQRASLMWAHTKRPATQILHYHAIHGTRFSKGLQGKDGNEVRVLGNGSVLIQQEGIYCVYSIITFVHTPSDRVVRNVTNDEYQIWRSRHSGQAVILSDRVRQTHLNKTETYKTIDLSGNFHLKKGDVLNPVIGNTSAVYSFTPANYWGVYQIKPKTRSDFFQIEVSK